MPGFICRIIFALAFLLAVSVRADALADLDAIVARASGLDDFLAKPELVNEYYKGLSAYYGAGRMNRKAFDEIIAQLREMKEKVPELKTRLWETTNLGESFSFAGTMKTYGRSIDRALWSDTHARFKAQLAAGLDGDTDKIVERLTKEVAAAEAGFANMTRREAAIARAALYETLRANPEAQRAATTIAHRMLANEEVNDKLGSGDADLVIDTIKELHAKGRKFLRTDPGPLLSMALDRLPQVDAMMADTKLFPVQMRKTNRGKEVPVGTGAADVVYHFKALPRRLHAIFKGVPLKECVGGCYVEEISAQRWATAALPDSRYYVVERETNGQTAYDGFIQHVPMKAKDGRIVASTDFGAPSLRNRLVVTEDGKPRVRFVYDRWLEEFSKRMPREWAGVAVSGSRAINNAGVLDTVFASPSYLAGESAGLAQSFSHLDDLAAKISRHSRRSSKYDYGKKMIFDGENQSAGHLILLDPNGEAIARDPETIRRVFAGDDLDRKARLLRYLEGNHEFPVEVTAAFEAQPNRPHVAEWDAARMDYNARVARTRGSRQERLWSNVVLVGGGLLASTLPFTESLPDGLKIIGGLAGLVTGATFIEQYEHAYPFHLIPLALKERRLAKAEAAELRSRGAPAANGVKRACRVVWKVISSRDLR